jgi:hypothetical protein
VTGTTITSRRLPTSRQCRASWRRSGSSLSSRRLHHSLAIHDVVGPELTPAKTPTVALEKLRSALRQSLETPAVRERLKSIIEVKTSTPDERRQIVERDSVKYEELVKEVGIKAVN